MVINVNSSQGTYDIILEKNALSNIKDYIDINRRYFVISDNGVPKEYQDTLLKQLPKAMIHIVNQGEESKSMATYEKCLKVMLENDYSRNDAVIALGGGVVGDLSGFVASTYKRGVDFINIPTTTLSQIDSSIGGKVAINMDHIKNCVGSFWQPKTVIIDSLVLKTLTDRHYNNGLIEAVKAGLLKDETLFEIFENKDIKENIDDIIYRSLIVKKNVVEEDEKEMNLRKILNFGHTIGHGYESYYNMKDLYHGEAVGLGMLAILQNKDIKNRLEKVLIKLNAPIQTDANIEEVYQYMKNDKKIDNDLVTYVQVDKIGNPELLTCPLIELKERIIGTK